MFSVSLLSYFVYDTFCLFKYSSELFAFPLWWKEAHFPRQYQPYHLKIACSGYVYQTRCFFLQSAWVFLLNFILYPSAFSSLLTMKPVFSPLLAMQPVLSPLLTMRSVFSPLPPVQPVLSPLLIVKPVPSTDHTCAVCQVNMRTISYSTLREFYVQICVPYK